MKAEVLKFEGIFNMIKDAKNTGVNAKDEIELAMAEYAKRYFTSFKFVEHWKYMIEKDLLQEYLKIPSIPSTPDMIHKNDKRPPGKKDCVDKKIKEMLLKRLCDGNTNKKSDEQSLKMMRSANEMACLMKTTAGLPKEQQDYFNKFIVLQKQNLNKQYLHVVDLSLDTNDSDDEEIEKKVKKQVVKKISVKGKKEKR